MLNKSTEINGFNIILNIWFFGIQRRLKKKLCQNIANKVLGKVRKFKDHIIILYKVIQNVQLCGPFGSP